MFRPGHHTRAPATALLGLWERARMAFAALDGDPEVHPHRRELRSHRVRRAGSVKLRPQPCLCPVRPRARPVGARRRDSVARSGAARR